MTHSFTFAGWSPSGRWLQTDAAEAGCSAGIYAENIRLTGIHYGKRSRPPGRQLSSAPCGKTRSRPYYESEPEYTTENTCPRFALLSEMPLSKEISSFSVPKTALSPLKNRFWAVVRNYNENTGSNYHSHISQIHCSEYCTQFRSLRQPAPSSIAFADSELFTMFLPLPVGIVFQYPILYLQYL